MCIYIFLSFFLACFLPFLLVSFLPSFFFHLPFLPFPSRLRYYVIMTSQRELFPRLTADMRRFKKLPQIYRDPSDPGARGHIERTEPGIMEGWKSEHDLWEETAIALTPEPELELVPEPGEHPSGAESEEDPSDFPDSSSPLFPLLNSEVISARKQIQSSVTEAMAHCRRDNLWRRLFHGEHAAHDKLKLSKLAFAELEELLDSVQSRSIGEIDPQLVNTHTHFKNLSLVERQVKLYNIT